MFRRTRTKAPRFPVCACAAASEAVPGPPGSSDVIDALAVALDALYKLIATNEALMNLRVSKRIVLVSNFADKVGFCAGGGRRRGQQGWLANRPGQADWVWPTSRRSRPKFIDRSRQTRTMPSRTRLSARCWSGRWCWTWSRPP